MGKPKWRQEFNACSNCERLEAEHDAVMVFVDKWLSEKQLNQSPANRANEAREVALKAIEALEAKLTIMEENERKADEHFKESVEMYMETIQALEAKLTRLVDAAELKRNVIIREKLSMVYIAHMTGNWVAIPEEDFDKLKAAIEAAKVTP